VDTIRKILVPTDFSPHADEAFRVAAHGPARGRKSARRVRKRPHTWHPGGGSAALPVDVRATGDAPW
jgi:hypothetical protein